MDEHSKIEKNENTLYGEMGTKYALLSYLVPICVLQEY